MKNKIPEKGFFYLKYSYYICDMINNIEHIKELITFNESDFYFVQILKRRKDNPDMPRDMVVIRNFYVESLNHFDDLFPHIKNICDYENARAYFRINKRNYKKISLQLIKRIADYISSENEGAIKNAFDSVAGSFHSDDDKKWIIDVDFDDDKIFIDNDMIQFVTRLQLESKREPLVKIISTKNGYHLITRPFNLLQFSDEYPHIDVHKDNPTLLYCP